MKSNQVTQFFLACLWSAAHASAQYNVTILPLPPGFSEDANVFAIPRAMNNRGQIAGVVGAGSMITPVVWGNGIATVLPVPAGFRSLGIIRGINDAGQVVGQIGPDPVIPNNANASRVVVWNGTTPTILPHFPATCSESSNEAAFISNVFGINRAGHLAGATLKSTQGSCYWGWIWDGTTFIREWTYSLPGCTGQGFTAVQPYGINDADRVASNILVSNTGCSQRASIDATPLAVPNGYLVGTDGNNINNLNQIYGNSPTTAFFWNGTSYTDAGPGNFLGLNNLGQALLLKGGPPRLFLWQNGSETQINLPSQIVNVQSPAAINDAGQIAFRASVGPFGSLSRVALLTPSEPCANDVSQQVIVTRGGFRRNRTTGRFAQVVTVSNNSGAAMTGPISLVLDNVPGSATLYGLSGATNCTAPGGSGFITIPGDLPNGGSASFTLDFVNTVNAGITYETRVLAGTGRR